LKKYFIRETVSTVPPDFVETMQRVEAGSRATAHPQEEGVSEPVAARGLDEGRQVREGGLHGPGRTQPAEAVGDPFRVGGPHGVVPFPDPVDETVPAGVRQGGRDGVAVGAEAVEGRGGGVGIHERCSNGIGDHHSRSCRPGGMD
jgi:hypothetical protein